MNDWTWEYLPGPEQVVGGLSAEAKEDVARLAQRLADAASVKYLGDPPVEDSGVSRILDHAEGESWSGFRSTGGSVSCLS